MNINDPKSSKNSKKPDSSQGGGNKSGSSAPLSSANDPTRLYPSNSTHTYSSDPSDYSYSNKPNPSDSKNYTHESLDTARLPKEDHLSKDKGNQRAQQEAFEDKTRETFNGYRGPRKAEDLYKYATSNKEQTITYILLGLGLLSLLIFNNMFGGLILGMVAGYYFSSEILYYLKNIGQILGGQDQLRYVVLTALLVGFFIAIPGIFLGAALVAIFKEVMKGGNKQL